MVLDFIHILFSAKYTVYGIKNTTYIVVVKYFRVLKFSFRCDFRGIFLLQNKYFKLLLPCTERHHEYHRPLLPCTKRHHAYHRPLLPCTERHLE